MFCFLGFFGFLGKRGLEGKIGESGILGKKGERGFFGEKGDIGLLEVSILLLLVFCIWV